MTTINNSSESSSLTEIAVAIGRIEEKVTRIQKIEDRLALVEKTAIELTASMPTKTPWFSAVAGISSLLSIAISSIVLIQFIQIAEAFSNAVK